MKNLKSIATVLFMAFFALTLVAAPIGPPPPGAPPPGFPIPGIIVALVAAVGFGVYTKMKYRKK